jgi:DNA sulfur modification protein DndC
MEWRKEFLRRLLRIQKEIRANGPNPNYILIAPEELDLIRDLWREEVWEDAVPQIYREVFGDEQAWLDNDGVAFHSEDFQLLKRLCDEEGIPAELPGKLIDQVRRMQGMSRRAGILEKIDSIFEEDWETEEEILELLEQAHAI